jgi:hypothetical protein
MELRRVLAAEAVSDGVGVGGAAGVEAALDGGVCPR